MFEQPDKGGDWDGLARAGRRLRPDRRARRRRRHSDGIKLSLDRNPDFCYSLTGRSVNQLWAENPTPQSTSTTNKRQSTTTTTKRTTPPDKKRTRRQPG